MLSRTCSALGANSEHKLTVPDYPLLIATAQSKISSSVSENGMEVRSLMQQAKEQGAQLIHFAECALSGYAKSQIKSWSEVKWDDLLIEQQLVMDEAKRLDLWVVLGCNHKLSAPNRPHNSLFIISNKGQLATRYDKQWCSYSEITDWYSPGNEYCVFEVEGWKFGCALCIEIQFPEVFNRYALEAVDCILFSSYSDNPMFGIQAQGYAASHNYWISCSVPTQMSHALPSRLIGPSGEIQNNCEPNMSTCVVSELNVEAPEWEIALKHNKPWRAIAREGSIYSSRLVQDQRSTDKSKL